MKLHSILAASIFSLLVSVATGAEKEVIYQIKDGVILADAHSVSQQFDWECKTEENALVLCRDKFCVPIWLESTAHLKTDNGVLVDIATLEKVIGLKHQLKGERLSFSKADSSDAPKNDTSVAYHSGWGEGRGFEPGQTLPDIPLIDLEGNEVRFSQFLGKRYIIYGWASW